MADPVIRLDTALSSVQPGGQARVQVTIANTGTVVEGYQIQVLGPSAAWSRVEPAEVSVYPQQEATVTLTFQPPAGTSVPGGRQGYGVLARSTLDPQFSAAAEGVVDVTAVLSVQAAITPVTSSGNWQGLHQLTLTNSGNDAVSLRVDAADPDETLGFRIRPASVTLPPGGRADVEVRAIAKKPLQWRTPARRPFRVYGIRADGQPVATAEAAFNQTPSGWIPVTTAVVVILAVVTMLAPLIIGQLPTSGAPVVPTLAARGAPPKPTGFKVEPVDATTVKVSWIQLESAQNYKLQRTDRAGTLQAEEPKVLTGERNVEFVKDLPAGEMVCFHLRVVRGGESPWSDVACAQLPKPPASPTPTPTPTPTPVDPAQPGLVAVSGSVTLDGNNSDWPTWQESAANYPVTSTSATPMTGKVYLRWDADALYVMARVTDKRLTPSPDNPTIYRGDAIAIEIGAKRPTSTDDLLRGADRYYMFGYRSPVAGFTVAASSVGVLGPNDSYTYFSKAQDDNGTPFGEGAQAVVKKLTGGYLVEAKIPWSTFSSQFIPTPGAELAANVSISDRMANGTDYGLVSTNPQWRDNQGHPGYWQRLVLQ